MNISTWLIRREFWENRAIWMIPAIFGALLILGALFGQVSLPRLTTQEQMHEAAAAYQVIVGAMFYVVMSVYATWYLLDCLYADRRDRSILFWKSLPISDTKTVLSKLIVAMVLIPLVYFAAADATALISALILWIRARA
jgi:ABC-2 type transport system permease protein